MVDYTNLVDTVIGDYVLAEALFVEARLVATYKAYQKSLKRHVAIQLLNNEDDVDTSYRDGFIRAAEIMAGLEHPHIAPIHHIGEYEDTIYIVTRLMTGNSLRYRIDNDVISIAETTKTIRQIGSALDYAHSQGRIHGDPSVANIAYDESGNAYIVDFHVAGIQGVSEKWIGTPVFMAPELYRAPFPSPESDQFALGSIACMMLTQSEEMYDKLMQYKLPRDGKFPNLREFNPDIPDAVEDVLKRVMAIDPEDRYPTVMDFSRDFDKALDANSKHLFISYSRRNTDYAQSLKEDLKRNGFDVWIDDAIEHGDQWFNEIHEAIKGCAAFLVIMTEESEKSEWVHKEVLLAKRYKKPIFPLLLKDQEFAILIDIQYADVRDESMPEANFYTRLRRVIYG